MGLCNVRKTVERYQGMFEVRREEQKFIAKAVMRNRIG